MPSLPANATEISRASYRVAQDLAERCPAELGEEIAVTGSVALGLADAASDIELNFWCESPPSVEARADWIRAVGGTIGQINANPWPDGTLAADFDYHGSWIEAGWLPTRAMDDRLAEILRGDVLSHLKLHLAWTIEKAVPLRAAGHLARWQAQLHHYPDGLQERLFETNLRVWRTTHAMLGRWTYCRRRQMLALTERLIWDTYNLLPVLFALNKRWEPDWKWLKEVTKDLPTQPDRLAERLEYVFLAPEPEQRVLTMLELIRDTLELLPEIPSVIRARASIAQCLAASPE